MLQVCERGAILVKISILKGKGLNLWAEPPYIKVYLVPPPGLYVHFLQMDHLEEHIRDYLSNIKSSRNIVTHQKHRQQVPLAAPLYHCEGVTLLVPPRVRSKPPLMAWIF